MLLRLRTRLRRRNFRCFGGARGHCEDRLGFDSALGKFIRNPERHWNRQAALSRGDVDRLYGMTYVECEGGTRILRIRTCNYRQTTEEQRERKNYRQDRILRKRVQKREFPFLRSATLIWILPLCRSTGSFTGTHDALPFCMSLIL